MITKIAKTIQEYLDGKPLLDDAEIDKVFLNYETISDLEFNEKLNEVNRPIIKIIYNKKVLYRKFKQGAHKGISKSEIGILKSDFNYLGIKKDQNVEVEIKLANYFGQFCFYWNNPKQDIRFAIRSAIFALALSFFIGFLVNYIYAWFDFNFHFFNK